jgi:hypothetical protein
MLLMPSGCERARGDSGPPTPITHHTAKRVIAATYGKTHMQTNLEQTTIQLVSSNNHEPLNMDVPMTVHHAIALLAFATASTFVRYIDEQVRASEHHYFTHGDEFSLGYLEGMQSMYGRFGRWRSVKTDHRTKACNDDSNPELKSEHKLDVASASLFLEYLDKQLRAAEHDYFDDGDTYSWGYLEAMQDMYSEFIAQTQNLMQSA